MSELVGSRRGGTVGCGAACCSWWDPLVVFGMALCFSVLCCGWLVPGEAEGFGFPQVVERAKDLAEQPYDDSVGRIPDFLSGIGYDDWRDIRFESDRALWLKDKLYFRVQFFHPGFFYDRTVKINVVSGGNVSEVAFSRDLFNYGRNSFKDRVPHDLGFAGFRFHCPINTSTYYDEVAVFLGATYLRAVAQHQQYGLSTRGLAIDTALSHGEEFPYFREFWLVKPAPGVKEVTVYGVIDSRSITGAYSYVIKPGKETVVLVKSVLWPRRGVEKLGVAPLNSMFFYGENTNERPDDYRSEVHDSDGLLVAFRSGERLWRPLKNPQKLEVNVFDAPDPIGFGLMQRDTNFHDYEDLEARYDLRPSVWIAPNGRWGEGHIELIQIPTDSGMHDNILAFWVPSSQPDSGEQRAYSYTMTWHFPDGVRPSNGHVAATRTARGKDANSRKFVIDFSGGQLESFPADKPLTGVVTVGEGATLKEQQLFKNRVTKGWRLVFEALFDQRGSMDRMLPNRRAPVELRAFLKDGESAVTETWSYSYER